MQQAERAGTGDRKREAGAGEVVATLRGGGESYAELAHDARNMVTALALYCELLEEPGVLNPGALHFAQELRVVTSASRRLMEKLARVEQRGARRFPGAREWRLSPLVEALPGTRLAGIPLSVGADRSAGGEMESVASELESNRSLLAALAGPGVRLRVKATGADFRVPMNGEDLTRVLMNLVRNASEAMRGSGAIDVELAACAGKGGASRVRLTVTDSGPGIPDGELERVFESGYTTRTKPSPTGEKSAKPSRQRGLGLSIVRNLVEAAGGRVIAANRAGGGARIAIELPVRTR